MNCESAFERMLEADPEELAGEVESELAAHIAQCARCGAVAAEILEGQARLAADIQALESRAGIDAVLPAIRRTTARRVRRRRLARFAAPMAAAAAVVVFALANREPATVDTGPVAQLAGIAPRPEQSVRLGPNTNAVVFKTRNPKITVVWFY